MHIRMKHSGSGDNVVINGCKFSSKNINIVNGKVIVDGIEQEGSLSGNISIEVNGDVEKIDTESGDVTVNGNTGSINTMSGDVTCNDVAGSVKTMNGDVKSTIIAGNVETMNGDIYGRRASN